MRVVDETKERATTVALTDSEIQKIVRALSVSGYGDDWELYRQFDELQDTLDLEPLPENVGREVD